MGNQLKQTEPRPRSSRHVSEHSETGRSWKAMVWTLLAVIVLIAAVCALWGHLSQNGTSTVNPKKTPPAAKSD